MAQRVLRVSAAGGGGAGEFARVQDAVDAVPLGNRVRTVIAIAPGVYREPVYVPKTKNLITFAAARPETTVISWDNTAARINHHQSSRVIGTGTFGCGTGSGQAVAIRVTADRCAFYNCRFLGWQDTLYLHYGKQYLRDCYIEGSVDFIFGNSTALLEHCHIYCKSPGFITAQSRKTPQESTGYVFLRCLITGNGSTSYMYLGRPWGPFGRVVFAYTWMDACIRPVGWNNWDKCENERSACFYEYRCLGPGYRPANRVTWARELLDEEAEQFLAHSFIDPDPDRPWLAQRMAIKIPHSA
ncbi:Pectinesterase 31 [Ananas comosus]|uniref:Pectinesterase n=1 Tax=Ananas comosus TaxID=4615 RepID=A0A199UJK9_ANACO|nr:Pectinesterase 31 [Ananas comosus]